MSRKILVLGGTRFFGKKLVQKLIDNGDSVTVFTRNSRFSIDREDKNSIKRALDEVGIHTFDLVYDQICYSPSAAKIVCDLFQDRVGRLIFTSSQSIYTNAGLQKESDFNPTNYEVKLGKLAEFEYGEAKRLSEAVYAHQNDFPVAHVRFPYVLGTDDYTKRLLFHIEHIKNGVPIVVRNASALHHKISMISSDEAAQFLYWLGCNKINGPINACSRGQITLSQLIEMIEKAVEKKSKIVNSGNQVDESPYEQSEDGYMANTLATELGFKFSHILDWLPKILI